MTTTRRTTTASLVLGAAGLGLVTLGLSTADAAVLGSVQITKGASGDNNTLIDGKVTAACPAGTGDSYFTIDGPDLLAAEAPFLPEAAAGGDKPTGQGAFAFTGASISNIKSTAGGFGASGTYFVRFSCSRASDGVVTDSYERALSYTYTSASSGSFVFASDPSASPSANVTSAPSPTPSGTASATSTPSASASATATTGASASPSASATLSASPSPSSSASASPSTSASASATPSASETLAASGAGEVTAGGAADNAAGVGAALPLTGNRTADLLAFALSMGALGAGLASLGRRRGWFGPSTEGPRDR